MGNCVTKLESDGVVISKGANQSASLQELETRSKVLTDALLGYIDNTDYKFTEVEFMDLFQKINPKETATITELGESVSLIEYAIIKGRLEVIPNLIELGVKVKAEDVRRFIDLNSNNSAENGQMQATYKELRLKKPSKFEKEEAFKLILEKLGTTEWRAFTDLKGETPLSYCIVSDYQQGANICREHVLNNGDRYCFRDITNAIDTNRTGWLIPSYMPSQDIGINDNYKVNPRHSPSGRCHFSNSDYTNRYYYKHLEHFKEKRIAFQLVSHCDRNHDLFCLKDNESSNLCILNAVTYAFVQNKPDAISVLTSLGAEFEIDVYLKKKEINSTCINDIVPLVKFIKTLDNSEKLLACLNNSLRSKRKNALKRIDNENLSDKITRSIGKGKSDRKNGDRMI